MAYVPEGTMIRLDPKPVIEIGAQAELINHLAGLLPVLIDQAMSESSYKLSYYQLFGAVC